MSADAQSYRRAMNAALLGLCIQLILAIALAIMGIFAQSPGINAIAWHLFGCVPIWGILWILFNQQRLELIETFEVEQISQSDATASALFDEAGDRLQLARKRVQRLQKFGLNFASIFVGLYFTIVGGTLLYVNYRGFQTGSLANEALGEQGRASLTTIMVLVTGLSFAAFIVARYIAGMTRVDHWRPLRAGSGHMMGGFFMLLALIAASIVTYVDYLQGFIALALIVPLLSTLLGVEMLITVLAEMYRPKRKGEMTRPAFDSRLLGWVSSPDSLGKIVGETLRYQFGLDFTSTWFYRLLSRAVLPLILIGVFVLVAMSSIVLVAPHQAAVITVFGDLVRTTDEQGNSQVKVYEPGVHFKAPWPFASAEKYDVQRVHILNVGSRPEGGVKEDTAILWTNEHTIGDEKYIVTAPTKIEGSLLSETAKSGAAGELIGADVFFLYRIKVEDLEQYISRSEDPAKMLASIAESVTSAYFAQRTVDDLLSFARVEAGQELLAATQQQADQLGLGLEILTVAVSAVHPPREDEVANKFLEQINALQTKQTTIEQARREAVAALSQVAGSQDMALRIDRPVRRASALANTIETLDADDPEQAQKREELSEELTRVEAEIERLISQAGGQAAQVIAQAQAYRWEFAIRETARAERFAAELKAFEQAPRYYAAQRYLQIVSEALANRRKIILAVENPDLPQIRFNLEDNAGAFRSVFDAE